MSNPALVIGGLAAALVLILRPKKKERGLPKKSLEPEKNGSKNSNGNGNAKPPQPELGPAPDAAPVLNMEWLAQRETVYDPFLVPVQMQLRQVRDPAGLPYYEGEINGFYTSEMFEAVKRFQNDFGISANPPGDLNDTTKDFIDQAYIDQNPVAGQFDLRLWLIQQGLWQLGFYPQDQVPNGFNDIAFEQAVYLFQQNQVLQPTGFWDDETDAEYWANYRKMLPDIFPQGTPFIQFSLDQSEYRISENYEEFLRSELDKAYGLKIRSYTTAQIFDRYINEHFAYVGGRPVKLADLPSSAATLLVYGTLVSMIQNKRNS